MDVVDGDLVQIEIQLTGIARPNPSNRSGHEIVQVSVCKSREFQCAETDDVQALVVQQHACVPISTS